MRGATCLLGLLSVTAAAVLAGSGACAIDDEVVWITDTGCTGSCTTRAPAELSCDDDRACSAGCEDWDCDEGIYEGPADAGDTGTGGDGGLYDADDGDVTDPPRGCEPTGGGDSPAAAEPVTLGEPVGELVACPRTSQWFRFTADAGARIEVDLATGSGGVAFILYAGDDIAAVTGADADGEASFSATAAAAGDFYLRFRSTSEERVAYGFTVRAVQPD